MRFRNPLAGVLVAVLMAGRAESASPSQPSYVVRLPPAGSYGSNDSVPGFLGMWFDPSCNTLGTGNGCPRPASTDFPFPVAVVGGGSGGGSVTQGTSPWVDNIAQFGGTTVSLGQGTMAQSMPVTFASNQTPLAVTQSGNWNVGLAAGSSLVGGFNLYIGGAANASGNPAFAQLTAGSAAIGTVGVTALPSLPAGSNAIGSVNVSNLPATQPVSGTIADSNSAAFQGVVALTPGTAGYTPLRSIGFICTAAGNITLTLADSSTITLGIVVSPAFQSLPFAVSQVALGSGTAGTFWNLK